jgi:hypothetical protein
MSLINDALQRAKQVQQSQPPAAGTPLQLRPVESLPEGKLRSMWTALIGFTAILVVALVAFYFFKASHRDTTFPGTLNSVVGPGSTPQKVAAREPGSTKPAAPDVQPARVTAPTPATVPVTNALNATPAPAIAKPSLPKLQAIIYSATRPSAIINGKTLYVGNRIGAYRITAIQPNSVTLFSGTETNVLTLGEE